MLKKIIAIFIFISFGIIESNAQTVQEIVRKAEKELYLAYPDYHGIELELLNAKAQDPKELDVDYLLAIVLLEQRGKSEALPYVKNIQESGEEYLRDFDFYRAYIEQRNENFTEAISYYQQFKAKLSDIDLKVGRFLSISNYLISDIKLVHANNLVDIYDIEAYIDNRILQCNAGKLLVKNKKFVLISNLGYDINSTFDEYSPVFSPIDTTLYFTSRRPIPNHLKKETGDELYLEHIFEADAKNGHWSKASFEEEPLNSFTHNVSALTINREGNDIFIFDYRNHGDIMHSNRISKGNWTVPVPFSSSFNSEKPERSFAISNDGKLAILERDGEKAENRDLYYSTFDGVNWSLPKNMGEVINTPFAEDGVFLHNNGKELYFSSKGHGGMGGYDIYKSVYKDSVWSKPENLGYPINTAYDDIYFIISDDGKSGFLSSNRLGGNGGFDIYHINLKPNPLEQEIIVSVIDADNGSYVNGAQLVLIDQINNAEYPMKRMPDGTYEAMIPNKENHTSYKIVVKKDGFVGSEVSFDVADSLSKFIAGSISLKEIKKEVVEFVFNDVYLFDLNSAKFFEKYYDRLNVLINALETYKVVILIEGHTDNSGSSRYNMKLSEKRALEVMHYLIEKGVDANQISYKGFGETNPLNDNSTKELRDLNRRVTVTLQK